MSSNNSEKVTGRDIGAYYLAEFTTIPLMFVYGLGLYFAANELEVSGYFNPKDHGTVPLGIAVLVTGLAGYWTGRGLGNLLSPGYVKRTGGPFSN